MATNTAQSLQTSPNTYINPAYAAPGTKGTLVDTPMNGAAPNTNYVAVHYGNDGSLVLNNTPVNPTPNASDVSSVNPLTVPNTVPSNSNSILTSTANASFTPPSNTSANTDGTASPNPAPETTSSNARDTALNQILGDTSTLATKGQVQNSLNSQYGVDEAQQNYLKAYNDYQITSLNFAKNLEDVRTGSGGTLESSAPAFDQLQKTQSYILANKAIAAQSAQGLYQGAMDIVQRKLDAQFQPIQTEIDNLSKFLQVNQNDLTESQKLQIQSQIDIKKQSAENLYNTKMAAHAAAVQNKAPQSVLNAIDNATDVNSTLTALGQYGQVNDFSLTTDPGTGLPILFNAKTGETQPLNNSTSANGGYTPPNPNKIVTDPSGTKYDLTTYAKDPQYGKKIRDNISVIGTVTDANSAQALIPAGSPVTGQMIMSAAQQFGVDPTTLASVLKVESNFGTKGAGAKTNNPGNVGNTDSGSTRTFQNVQDGVNAAASALATRKIGAQSPTNTNTTTTSNTGAASIQTNIQKVQTAKVNAPATYSGAINYMPSTGDGYLNIDAVDSNFRTAALNYAKANNLVPLTSAQTNDVQSIDTALANLNTIQQKFSELAPQSFFGKAGQGFLNPTSTLLSTDRGNKINAYNSSTLPAAVDALNTVTGSKRLSAFTGNVSSNSLPTLTHGVIANRGDTLQGGLQKIDVLRTDLNNALRSVIPSSSGAPLSANAGSTSYQPGQVVPGANGAQYQISADGKSAVRIK